MIKSLRLINFQSHRDNTIPFHPGVNAIVGKSDSGKSTIFRALNWVINNQPSGDAFRSHWGGDTCVEITLTNGTVITRKRTDKDNLYILDGKELKAFGQGAPPQEIKDALRIEDINMQTQMEAPFLLGSNGGEVARYLNKIVSLDSIDSTLANINRELTNAKRDLNRAQTDKTRFQEEVDKYDYLPAMEVDCKALEDMEWRNISLEDRVFQLNVIISHSKEHAKTIDKTTTLIKEFDKKLVDTQRLYNEAAAKRTKATALHSLLNSILRQQGVLKALPIYTGASVLINATQADFAALDQLQKQANRLDDMLNNIDKEEQRITQFDKIIAATTEEYDSLMPDICPLCGQEVNKCEQSPHQKTKRRGP
jgi:DNA repair exonuclease SbcCD ATPase subunit